MNYDHNQSVDLAAETYDLLYGVSQDRAESFRAIFQSQHGDQFKLLSTDDQIIQLNNFWRIQLGLVNVDTLDTRRYLYDNISARDWLSNFKRFILNAIAKYSLPCQSYHVSHA